jgi:hypothetical protein
MLRRERAQVFILPPRVAPVLNAGEWETWKECLQSRRVAETATAL